MPERDRDQAFSAHRKAQRRAWLALEPRARLEWLEQAKRFATLAIAAAERRRQKRGKE
jgi:hypothetical protein